MLYSLNNLSEGVLYYGLLDLSEPLDNLLEGTSVAVLGYNAILITSFLIFKELYYVMISDLLQISNLIAEVLVASFLEYFLDGQFFHSQVFLGLLDFY